MPLEPGVHLGSATYLPLPDESVDCIVTSPPYNLGMDYSGVSDSYEATEYVDLAIESVRQMWRVTKPGARVWLNLLHVAPQFDDLEKLRAARLDPEAPRAAKLDWRKDPFDVWRRALDMFGFKYRDTVAWIQPGFDQATAWGSMLSPNAPNLRGRWEPIGLFFKGTWARGRTERNDLTWDEFSVWTRNVWEIRTEYRRGHPAPFPEEIPRRAIKLSTWPGDVVLDPFCGSGTTLKVAKDLGRIGIGFDLSPEYVEMTRRRCAQEVLGV